MSRRLLISPSVVLIAVAACHQPRSPGFADSDTSIDASFQQLWQASLEQLRQRRFTLDRTDLREGLITTKPVGSQHFFEFWRRDVASSRDFWEASLCPIRRIASVTIKPGGRPGTFAADVVVLKQRYSTPERQYNSAASAFHFFLPSLPAVSTGRTPEPDESTWIDIGRDQAMERLLRAEILSAASRYVTPPEVDAPRPAAG